MGRSEDYTTQGEALASCATGVLCLPGEKSGHRADASGTEETQLRQPLPHHMWETQGLEGDTAWGSPQWRPVGWTLCALPPGSHPGPSSGDRATWRKGHLGEPGEAGWLSVEVDRKALPGGVFLSAIESHFLNWAAKSFTHTGVPT